MQLAETMTGLFHRRAQGHFRIRQYFEMHLHMIDTTLLGISMTNRNYMTACEYCLDGCSYFYLRN
jgi:uncharacterized protein YutD